MHSVMSVLLWVSGGLVTGPHTDRAWWLIDKAAIVSIGHSSLSGWWPAPGSSPWGQPSQSENDEAVVCSKWAGGGRAFAEVSYFLWKVGVSDLRLLAFRISILASFASGTTVVGLCWRRLHADVTAMKVWILRQWAACFWVVTCAETWLGWPSVVLWCCLFPLMLRHFFLIC